MSAVYADTSAVVSAYFADEPEHAALREFLLSGKNRVLTSELTRVEFASAVTAAKRAGRIPDGRAFLDQFDEDARSGLLGLIPLVASRIMPAARRLVTENHPLRTLDAIHLAVALHETAPLTSGEPVALVTRDQRQAEAAKAHGLEVH
ncbi:type II toxin-antitoxin system VapC family toxin [Amycolatopsis acidiphila]|uniref:type II toxin-antitoxin system VapC family toxin n=1 Tax=Amycolatopsis acidiphila TaxID=715473 RepID=UPI0019C53E1B|nr:type II toxin-antitoxin system VapC family toxin [Amycolatopsis acidiphila]UIJ58899.1 type II toxin-antitoxin system VapC family toxin [Amycolatopsis acidiphila]GHG72661.1 ribonuclease VapC [Amycolatopsis acidiphila]